ncbi:uncharacterized protein LOC131860421 [Cryptomeria japonica]|uniref:uncharacterized protein LOC131860421 n=1 Tax=Cryptomeria japonica TaxID=3369 RepID=UPI0027DA37B6|nr:uncharacterized protein LOC131860421 [Cryptomeria japonica]
MEFDGRCASSDSGAGVVLISSQGDIIPFSFKLDFKNTNNTAKCEALILGISEAKNKGIKLLREKGDAELIVKQVRNLFLVKNERLKHYKNRAWDEIEFFDAFLIEVVPREQNTRADSLVVSTSLLLPHPDFKEDTYKVEMIYRPSVPNNVQKWQIPLKPGTTPFKQKLRNSSPMIAEEIFKEVDKMLKARIIYPIHHSTWVANIVPVRKKNGEIRICVDFRNLNRASLKDNHALPNMDHILQTVAGAEMMSMLDRFFGYNQMITYEK